MNDALHLKYLMVSPEDLLWGLAVNSVGFQEVGQVRLSKVKEAITNTKKPIKQIAYEMGFENEDYFFTAFRRLTGMTPVEYREFTGNK